VETLVREIRPDANPVVLPLTMLFFGMINWTHTWFRPEGQLTAEQLADLAVQLMLDGLGAVQAS
jgi:TetR/AcrR family transcriptional regulator